MLDLLSARIRPRRWRALGGALVLTLALLPGCDFQRTVDVPAPAHDPTLVLNGEMVAGAPWRLDVSRSVGAFEPTDVGDTSVTVTDATVTVSRGDEQLGRLRLDSTEQYSTRRFRPEPGARYTVRVSAPDLETVEATDRVPQLPPVRLASESIEEIDGYYNRELRLTIDDPEDTSNYYHILLRKRKFYRDSTESGGTRIYRSEKDETFRTRDRSIIDEMERLIEESNVYRGREATFTDVLFGGTEHTIRLLVRDNLVPLAPGEEGHVRTEYLLLVSALSTDAYQYARTKRLFERTDENPFAEPVRVFSNVEGGYGIVGGRATDTLRIDVRAPQSGE
jgi:hypothetical protein